MSFQRRALHVAEALEEAKLDAGVGDAADWLIMQKDGAIGRLPAKHKVLEDLKTQYAGKASDLLDADHEARKALGAAIYKAPMMPFRFNALEA